MPPLAVGADGRVELPVIRPLEASDYDPKSNRATIDFPEHFDLLCNYLSQELADKERNTFALCGRYGSGKTSTVKRIDAWIKSSDELRKFYKTIYVDCSSLEQKESLLFPLLFKLYEKLGRPSPHKSTLSTIAYVPFDLLARQYFRKGMPEIDKENTKRLDPLVHEINQKGEDKSFSNPDYKKAQQEIKSLCVEILDAFLKERPDDGGRLVLLLDDLDRCLYPANVIRLLLSLQTVFRNQFFYSIAVLDPCVLASFIRTEFDDACDGFSLQKKWFDGSFWVNPSPGVEERKETYLDYIKNFLNVDDNFEESWEQMVFPFSTLVNNRTLNSIIRRCMAFRNGNDGSFPEAIFLAVLLYEGFTRAYTQAIRTPHESFSHALNKEAEENFELSAFLQCDKIIGVFDSQDFGDAMKFEVWRLGLPGMNF